jgi:hypothetical protein
MSATSEDRELWAADDHELLMVDDSVNEVVPSEDEIPARPAAPVRRQPAERPRLFLLTPAHPTPLTSLIRSDRGVEDHRSLFCDRYDACLDHAVICGWVSWTCAQCPLFATAGGVCGAA